MQNGVGKAQRWQGGVVRRREVRGGREAKGAAGRSLRSA